MDLVAVEDSEICISNWQLPVRVLHHVKHHTMTWAVHRFHTILHLRCLDKEHVLLILVPVPRYLKEFTAVKVWRQHFLVSSQRVLMPEHLHPGEER